MSFFKRIGQAARFLSPAAMLSGGRQAPYQQGANPAGMANPYLDQIPQQVGPYYEPFIESGRQASGAVNPIYDRMSTSPGAFIEELMQGYAPSRGYRFKQGEMERSMRNSAAHGGFVGTPYNQQQQGELTQGLLSQDMQQFLANLLGVQQGGLEGQEGRIGRGFQASTGYGDILGNKLASQAGLAFQGQAGQNQLGADAYSQRMTNQTARRNGRMNFLSSLLGSAGAAGGGGFGR